MIINILRVKSSLSPNSWILVKSVHGYMDVIKMLQVRIYILEVNNYLK